jgi:hypothetical protein
MRSSGGILAALRGFAGTDSLHTGRHGESVQRPGREALRAKLRSALLAVLDRRRWREAESSTEVVFCEADAFWEVRGERVYWWLV